MKFSELSAAAFSLALTAAPAFAQAQRASNRVAEADQFGGDSTLLLILAVLLIGAGIAVMAGNNSDTPSSP